MVWNGSFLFCFFGCVEFILIVVVVVSFSLTLFQTWTLNFQICWLTLSKSINFIHPLSLFSSCSRTGDQSITVLWKSDLDWETVENKSVVYKTVMGWCWLHQSIEITGICIQLFYLDSYLKVLLVSFDLEY